MINLSVRSNIATMVEVLLEEKIINSNHSLVTKYERYINPSIIEKAKILEGLPIEM